MGPAVTQPMPTLGFHGAARTVTGSRYLLTHRDRRTLIDVGLFQGLKELRELNWRPPPFPARSVDRVLLTHTHIDHAGALPEVRVHIDSRMAVDATRIYGSHLDEHHLDEEVDLGLWL